jgi:hypothetical protein
MTRPYSFLQCLLSIFTGEREKLGQSFIGEKLNLKKIDIELTFLSEYILPSCKLA